VFELLKIITLNWRTNWRKLARSFRARNAPIPVPKGSNLRTSICAIPKGCELRMNWRTRARLAVPASAMHYAGATRMAQADLPWMQASQHRRGISAGQSAMSNILDARFGCMMGMAEKWRAVGRLRRTAPLRARGPYGGSGGASGAARLSRYSLTPRPAPSRFKSRSAGPGTGCSPAIQRRIVRGLTPSSRAAWD